MTTRTEHLDWCKTRALEYLDSGDLTNALASMMSDLSQHEETKNHVGIELGMQLFCAGLLTHPQEMRGWITGFN